MKKCKIRRLCVFCGSQAGNKKEYSNAAKNLGRGLVERGIALVYGGGSIGLMGMIADEVLGRGEEVCGVIPRFRDKKGIVHEHLSHLEVVDTMHERKARMSALADAFVAMPGGYGTLEEIFEVTAWVQLGIQVKPLGLFNINGYYDPLLSLVGRGVEDGFIRPQQSDLFVVEQDPEALLDRLHRYQPPPPISKLMGFG